MNIKAFVIVAVCLIYWSPPAAADSIGLMGDHDCGSWVSARKAENSIQALVDQDYVTGFLNGLAFGSWKEFWNSQTSAAGVYLWLNNWCQANPLDGINKGLIKLFRERTQGQNPQTPSGN